jgi:hypothetical protein
MTVQHTRTQAIDELLRRLMDAVFRDQGKIPTVEVYDLRSFRPNVEVTSNVVSHLIGTTLLASNVNINHDMSYHMYLIVNNEVRYITRDETIYPRHYHNCWVVCIRKKIRVPIIVAVAVRASGYAQILATVQPYINTHAGQLYLQLQQQDAGYNTKYMPYAYNLEAGINARAFAGWLKEYVQVPSKHHELFQEQLLNFVQSLPPVEHSASADIVTIERAPALGRYMVNMMQYSTIAFGGKELFSSLNAIELPRHSETFAERQTIFNEWNRQNNQARLQLVQWVQRERELLQQANLHNLEFARQALVLIDQANGILLTNPNQPELRNQITELLRQVSVMRGIQQIHSNNPLINDTNLRNPSQR